MRSYEVDVRLNAPWLPCRVCDKQSPEATTGIWIFYEDLEPPRRVCSPACARKIIEGMERGGPTRNPDFSYERT